jgi:hypothetical protein
MIGAGVGEQVGGAGKDIAVSSSPLGDIIEERAGRVPVSATMNALMTGVGQVAGRVLSPFQGVKTGVETGLDEATVYFREKYGVNYPRTLGEETGSSVLKRVESAMSRNPGSSANFDAFQQKKLEAFREIQQKMLASEIDPSDVGLLQKLAEDVGEDAVTLLKSKVNPVLEAQVLAKDQSAKLANDTLMNELSSAAGPARQIYPERVGASIRARAFADRDSFQSQMNQRYEQLYSLPGGKDKILEPPNLVDDAKKLLKEQPAPEITTTVPSPIVGPSGQPLTITTTGEKMLREFVPGEAVGKLQSLATLDRAKFSLQDLVKMRTEVRNDIAKGEAIPGVSTHYLGEIEKTLTKAIEEGTDAIPDKTLRDTWKAVNSEYAQGVTRFKDNTISRLFKDVESGAFVQNEDIVRNIGATEYQSFKKFLGENSTEFMALKRGILDNLVTTATPAGGELVDAGKFLQNLNHLVVKNRAVAEDILGPARIEGLVKVAKIGKLLQEEMIPKDELTALMSGTPQNLERSLRRLINAQTQVNETYRNSILKDVATGKLGDQFDSGEFVNRMYKSSSPKEVKQVVDLLKSDPKKMEELQRKTVERILYETQREVRTGDAARVGGNDLFRPTNTSALERVLGSGDNKAKLKEILGPEKMEDFDNLAKLLRGSEVAEKTFRGASTFAAAEQVNSMLRGGVFSYLGDWMKQKIVATMYSSKTIGDLLSNQAFAGPEGRTRLARMIVTSQPFVSAMTEDFGEAYVGPAMDAIYNSIDRFEEQGQAGTPALRRQDWVDQILNENRPEPKVMPIQRN